jgi:hypothetical protein
VTLKPQDLVVLLKIALAGDKPWSYPSLAHDLGLSASEVHAAVRRASHVGLIHRETRRPNRAALLELLFHGVRYVFAPERGAVTRGLPTAHAAPPLSEKIVAADELPPVWPTPNGTVRGETLSPLYKSVPEAAKKDPRLYECLALVDAIRVGRARERKLAEALLRERLT